MSDFNTSLLREKFVIRDLATSGESDTLIALSNRIVVPMISPAGKVVETFIVRGQNMHTTVRLAAKMVEAFKLGGRIMKAEGFDWLGIWLSVIEAFERKYNPLGWAVIYFEGKPVFQSGEHHPFLDVIESFDALQKDDYKHSLALAEQAFQDAGKPVKIDYETNVAMVVSINSKQAKCGVILRGAGQTTTFNFTARGRTNDEIHIADCLILTALYLEAVQLAFQVGVGKRKIYHEAIEDEQERIKTFDAEKRFQMLNQAIIEFDEAHEVNYRPDKPNLFQHISRAEKYADRIIKSQKDNKI